MKRVYEACAGCVPASAKWEADDVGSFAAAVRVFARRVLSG